MRQRPPIKVGTGNTTNNAKRAASKAASKAASNTRSNGSPKQLFLLVVLLMATLQIVLNSISRNGNHQSRMNSYDALLKNTIHYSKNISSLQEQIDNLRSQITTLESKSQKYTDDPLFFPFVIRDSRHLTPAQINPDFHVFDYVDLTQAKQPKAKHSQLLHNARLVVDDVLEAKRAKEPTAKKGKYESPTEKFEAPCQKYSIECYAQKILQVFSYVLREFPSVEYYFYVEADNDLYYCD